MPLLKYVDVHVMVSMFLLEIVNVIISGTFVIFQILHLLEGTLFYKQSLLHHIFKSELAKEITDFMCLFQFCVSVVLLSYVMRKRAHVTDTSPRIVFGIFFVVVVLMCLILATGKSF